MKDNEVVKKALEAATAATGKEVKTFLKEKGYAAEPKAKPAEAAELVEPRKERTTPIWPMDDEQIAQWRKDVAMRKEASAIDIKEPPLTKERIAELHALASASVKRIPRRTPSKKKEEVVKEPKVANDKKDSTRQIRQGQTKLIDGLLKEGKSEKEIFDAVREKIPTYPPEKLPKLIKLRQYHLKQK